MFFRNLIKAYAEAKGKNINWNDWSNAPMIEQLGPEQKNGVDCGVFLCQYVDYLSRNAPLDFSQSGMTAFRKRMLYELLKNEMLEPPI